MSGWQAVPPPHRRIGPLGWLRVAWRGGLVSLASYGGLLVLLLVRLVEWPLCGQARPVTPRITQGVCRFVLWALGLPLVVHGRPMTAPVSATAKPKPKSGRSKNSLNRSCSVKTCRKM